MNSFLCLSVYNWSKRDYRISNNKIDYYLWEFNIF